MLMCALPQLLMMTAASAGHLHDTTLVSGLSCALGCSTMTVMDQGRVFLVGL